MMNGPFGGLERVAHLRPHITHLADIPQLAGRFHSESAPTDGFWQAGRFEPAIKCSDKCSEHNFRNGSKAVIRTRVAEMSLYSNRDE